MIKEKYMEETNEFNVCFETYREYFRCEHCEDVNLCVVQFFLVIITFWMLNPTD